MSYVAPVKDMLFNIEHLAASNRSHRSLGLKMPDWKRRRPCWKKCAKFNEGVLAPLNWEGDKNPSSWHDGVVTATPGFKEAFKQFTEGGWQGLAAPRGLWWPGPAKDHWGSLRRNAELCQHELCPVPPADAMARLKPC